MKNNSKTIKSWHDLQDRRRVLWLSAIVLSAIGIAAWACYVDPDEGYNRFDQYGWSWQVFGPLAIILAVVATVVFGLWLIFRRHDC
jgi:hypothetical protein